jgi:hypothetical protein
MSSATASYWLLEAAMQAVRWLAARLIGVAWPAPKL